MSGSSLVARIEVAIDALKGGCTCSRECDGEREHARKVLQLVLTNIELIELLSGQAVVPREEPPLPTVK